MDDAGHGECACGAGKMTAEEVDEYMMAVQPDEKGGFEVDEIQPQNWGERTGCDPKTYAVTRRAESTPYSRRMGDVSTSIVLLTSLGIK